MSEVLLRKDSTYTVSGSETMAASSLDSLLKGEARRLEGSERKNEAFRATIIVSEKT